MNDETKQLIKEMKVNETNDKNWCLNCSKQRYLVIGKV